MDLDVHRQIRNLKLSVCALTVICSLLAFSAFTPNETRPRFEEIDVERINIVESDGRLRMVLSNQARQHPGIVNGKIIPRENPRPPGILFFNHLGDEMGGLIFGANGEIGHFGSLTFDKVRNDQTIGFRHLEGDNGRYSTGIEMWQQPDLPADVVAAKYAAASSITDEKARRAAIESLRQNNELTTNRLFLGKARDNSLLLQMADIKGRTRITVQVAPDGTPKLEFLGEDGELLYSLPPASAAESAPPTNPK
jgi:hypothetical protein